VLVRTLFSVFSPGAGKNRRQLKPILWRLRISGSGEIRLDCIRSMQDAYTRQVLCVLTRGRSRRPCKLLSQINTGFTITVWFSKHLRDAIEITTKQADVMPVEHARALFKLSEALLQDPNDSEEANRIRDEAEVYLLKRDACAVSFSTEEDYDKWVPIFWR